ncbi:MAG: site-specific DNA-methyltransferase [Deltaproteobacteria bacterium]|nr:site-specific DNA-methyltransferase [Deltaproteobacteria bacterium]
MTGETQLDLFKKAKNGTDDNWQNLIVQGDNLQFLKTCYRNADPLIKGRVKGKVKLIYIDPPFATKSDFKGSGDEKSYSDKVHSTEFIEGLREHLIYLREILADNGSMYVHLDEKMSHYVKLITDEIFGKENFRNEIIWSFTGRLMYSPKKFNCKHNSIYLYSKSDKHRLNEVTEPIDRDEYLKMKKQELHKDDDGREWIWGHAGKGKSHEYKIYIDEVISKGRNLSSTWKIPIVNTSSKERLDYPTQKPEALLERIIRASSNPGDLVIDVFGGSGTTAAVAEKLGRRWIVCDFGKHAIYTMQKRMLRIGESKALGSVKGGIKKNQKYGETPKPFCVVSTGAYDFSRIMKLRENKDAYIDFVLGLFQSSRDEKDLSGKYRLANIFGEKEGDPVEVYPVWNDEYLKNIRIDEKYLKGIILQSRGKLKGNYYIITPETCTLVGDTTMKNSAGNEVHFKMLKFPYKILEDVSRNFQIQQQPSSQENVNNLINSTGFYFNDDVEIEVEKTKQGLKITRFETKILDKQGERLKALDGLAMLLVDVDYDGDIFDMDRTVFAKDISDEGKIRMTGLTESVAVIAIDKHGNESKPFVV